MSPRTRQRDARRRARWSLAALTAIASPALAQGPFETAPVRLASYAIEALDAPGSSTGAASVALGVPDYRFVNDAGLSFGGTNTDVFDPGEATVLVYAFPLKNIADQADLVLSAFVGGSGATDDAQVQVEVSGDGVQFHTVATIATASGRTTYPHVQERHLESVKHFEVDFGAEDLVTHVRLSNLAGTPEGLRLDAVEGLYPLVGSVRAMEFRFEKYRGSDVNRFLLRIKNLADPGGVGIHELRIDKPDPPPQIWLQDTWTSLYSNRGQLLCVENCVFDNGPDIHYSRHAWSEDDVNEAPTGIGLGPGRQAAHRRWQNFDLDMGMPILTDFVFTVVFTDGTSHRFDFNDDVLGQELSGALYQKYMYFDPTPQISGPHQTYYYQYVQR